MLPTNIAGSCKGRTNQKDQETNNSWERNAVCLIMIYTVFAIITTQVNGVIRYLKNLSNSSDIIAVGGESL